LPPCCCPLAFQHQVRRLASRMSSESYPGYPECVVSCHGADRFANSIRAIFYPVWVELRDSEQDGRIVRECVSKREEASAEEKPSETGRRWVAPPPAALASRYRLASVAARATAASSRSRRAAKAASRSCCWATTARKRAFSAFSVATCRCWCCTSLRSIGMIS